MMATAPPGFAAYYAAVLEAEAARRPHQPAFAALLREWAAKARKERPVQGDLFAAMEQEAG